MPIAALKKLFGWVTRTGVESRRFGNYHLIKIVHDGEKATVYQARSGEDGALYAVKAYKPHYNRVADRMCRRYHIRTEGDIGRSLNPKPGAPVEDYPIPITAADGFEFGDKARGYYLVQEYVEGLNLKNLVGRENALQHTARFRIVSTVGRALGIIHNRGLVHRDICSDNIIIQKDGQGKLLDLGFVAPRGLKFREQSGTPSYMSPEQFLIHPLNPTSDIYSFGVVLFELFTGELPFTSIFTLNKAETQHRRMSELMDKHLHELPPRPSAIKADLPEGLEEVILKCLEKDPTARYQSMRDLLQAVSGVQRKEGRAHGSGS